MLVVGSDTAGWRVIAMDTGGAPRWELTGARAPRSTASGVTIGRDDSAYVVGSWFDDARRLRVVKLRGKDVVWTYLDGSDVPIPHDVTTLRDGTVVVVGETNQDWLLLGLGADGKPRWRVTYDGGGTARNPDQAFAVAPHPDGGFVVAGRLVHPLPPTPPLRGLVDWRVAHYRVRPSSRGPQRAVTP